MVAPWAIGSGNADLKQLGSPNGRPARNLSKLPRTGNPRKGMGKQHFPNFGHRALVLPEFAFAALSSAVWELVGFVLWFKGN